MRDHFGDDGGYPVPAAFWSVDASGHPRVGRAVGGGLHLRDGRDHARRCSSGDRRGPARQRGDGGHSASRLCAGGGGGHRSIGAVDRPMAAPHDAAVHPDLSGGIATHLGAGADVRGARPGPGAVCHHPWVDVVGDRSDRCATGAADPRRPGHRRGLCGNRSGAGRRESPDRADEPTVGMADGRRRDYRGGHRGAGGRPPDSPADGDAHRCGRPAPDPASPQPTPDDDQRADSDRSHRALHLLHLHRGHHP